MSGNSFGTLFRITTWGESHGPAIGVVVDGCPAGLPLSEDDIQPDMDRRRVGQSKIVSPRKETDRVQILSGVFEGITTGMPISIVIQNEDANPSQYAHIKHLFRPGHADYTYQLKYGNRDWRGGGRSSARETAGRVAAGAIARKILRQFGIKVVGYTIQVGHLKAKRVNFDFIEQNPVRCPDPEIAPLMVELIQDVRIKRDSIGGVVEIIATGMPVGLGEPVFDRLNADLAKALFSIGAVKGVEFGAGFAVATMHGSENNDELFEEDDLVSFRTNNAGGTLGGISSGQDLVMRVAIKPPASIPKNQNTVDLSGKTSTIEVTGRHDPNLCPRFVPVGEAMVALVLVEHLLRYQTVKMDLLRINPRPMAGDLGTITGCGTKNRGT